jgi:hypothetical protein
MEKVPYLGKTLTRWQVGNSTFLALPEQGARLMNWHLNLGDGTVRDIIYWPEDADFNAFHKVRGGNPILFPFNARTFDAGELGFWRDPAGVEGAGVEGPAASPPSSCPAKRRNKRIPSNTNSALRIASPS